MMWFAAYSEKEELGIENRTSMQSVLYGLAILSFLKKNGVHIKGFRIYLLSGSLDISWQEKIRQETGQKDLLMVKTGKEKLLILATTQGYMQLMKLKSPEDQISSISEKDAYYLLKCREGETQNSENR